MTKLKPEVLAYIKQQSPTGITLTKNQKGLYVKVAKMVNGKEQSLTKTISMDLDNSMSVADMKSAFETTLSLALTTKRQFKVNINNPNFTSFHTPTAKGVGTLGGVFQMMFMREWGQCTEKQQDQVKSFYKDLEEFFTAEKKLSEFTIEDIDGYENQATGELENGFKQWVAQKIIERPKNMTGTVSHNSINKRLGVLRSIQKYALSKRLLGNDQLINPDKRVKNMGIVDLPRGESKRKPALTYSEQETFLAVVAKCGVQDDWDMWAWAFDTGMRHDGELDNFKIDDVDFGRKTITFWRTKTNGWSVEMPLTGRCQDILKRQRSKAQLRDDRKVFPSTAGSRTSNWKKYIAMCNFAKHFTPYTTRHTYITRLAEADVNPKVTMELAGHSCIETTLTNYTKSSSKILSNAILKLEQSRDAETNDSIVNENEANSLIGHNSKRALK